MKLSAALLCERLGQYVLSFRAGTGFDSLCLGRPEFLTVGAGELRGRLLIARADDITTCPPAMTDCCLIYIGGESDIKSPEACSIIFVRKDADIFTLFNALQKLYDEYDVWDDGLRRCVALHRDVQSIIDISGPLFENPLCYADASGRLTAVSDSARGGEPGDVLPRDPAALFRVEPPGAVTLLDRDELIVRSCSADDKNLLCVVLRSHLKFAGGILLAEKRVKFRGSDPALLAHMAGYVLMLFEYNAALRKTSTFSLVTVFIRLLDGQNVGREDLERALSVFDWTMDDCYETYYLKLPSPEFDYNYLTYQGRQLEKQLSSALAIAYGGDIVIIHNLSRAKDREPSAQLHAFLRARELGYGRSRVFHNIGELQSHYLQAAYALNYGRSRYPSKLFHRFSDYCLEFMIEHCVGGQSPESLYPGGLSELAAHDGAHGTKHMETLLAFCAARFNATHAADALHIHRTTFLDRMKRIRDVLDTDFDDPADRLQLLLALELMRTAGE